MNDPKIFIGENGFAEDEGVDSSENKIAYHKVSIYLKVMSNKIVIDLSRYSLSMIWTCITLIVILYRNTI